MYAVTTTVTIAKDQFESSRKTLMQEVVPKVKQSPGFVKGYWSVSADHTQGLSLVIFDTKANADNAAKMARSMPAPAGVTMTGVEVREVVAES